jgi:hypothetical protein
MLQAVKFQPEHLTSLALQEGQAYMQSYLSEPGYANFLLSAGPALTVMAAGKVIAIAGIAEVWAGRGAAWLLMADGAGRRHMVALHRAVRAYLDGCGVRRVECYVDRDFLAGHRWARMLGFEREGLMRAFGAHGGDMVMYARVQ